MTDETPADDGHNETNETDESIQSALQQADQFHAILDQAKEWSRETATSLRVEAALADDEEDAERLAQAVALVRTVADRIEQGDSGRSRQPSAGRS